jgi:hypothetical protein
MSDIDLEIAELIGNEIRRHIAELTVEEKLNTMEAIGTELQLIRDRIEREVAGG